MPIDNGITSFPFVKPPTYELPGGPFRTFGIGVLKLYWLYIVCGYLEYTWYGGGKTFQPRLMYIAGMLCSAKDQNTAFKC